MEHTPYYFSAPDVDAPPASGSRVKLEAAIRTLITLDSWTDEKDRARLRRDVLETLAIGAFSDGFDQGYEQARTDVNDALN